MHCLKIINIIIWRILKFYDEKMKKSLIVAMLSMLLSVNVLTPMSYAVENVWELSGIAENGGENAENGANGSSWTEGEGSYVWNTQDSSVTPQNDDNMSSWTEGEGSYEWQTWNQLDSSVTLQNDGNDGQDSSLDAQNDNQDDTANPEDLLAMPLAGPMQFGPDPDPQPEEPVNPEADPNADPATPDEDSDDAPTQRSTVVKDLHLYFVNGSETKHYTIMDRNMWARDVNQWWYYYQWWNNWWFDYPLSGTTTTQVLYDTWYPYEEKPSTYSSSTFVLNGSNWQAWTPVQKFNSNLWWWKDDESFKNRTWKAGDRQWPCTTGYYVPSAYDFNLILNAWTWSYPNYDNSNHNAFYDKFASDLLLTLDWKMSNSNWSIDSSWQGHYWTSSPANGPNWKPTEPDYTSNKSSNLSRRMSIQAEQFSVGHLNRSAWMHVRCFKDTFKPDGSEADTEIQLKIELNGGKKTVIAVDADKVVKTLNSPEKDDYDFIWWYTTPDFQSWTEVHIGTQIQKGATLYAKWVYDVKFVNYDGTVLETGSYASGTLAANIKKPEEDPTRAEDAKCVYTFTGWDPAIADVTDDVTYTAQYDCNIKSYTITWKNDDGSVIDTTTIKYWVKPIHEDASKENTAEWTYTFSGWTPEVLPVTWDATYTATFSQTKNSYTITWLNDDDTQIDTTTVEYWVVPTHADATKAATAEYTYTFSGWTPEVVAVTGEATYKATFSSTKNKYTVIFKDADWNVISEEEIEYGQTPTAPADPTKEWHTFSGWSPAIWPVTEPVNYEPIFTINKHIVTWQNYDGTELEKDENVEYWTMPAYDWATPTRYADAQYTYTFAAWSPAISTVKGDIVYTATYSTTVNEYTVTFLDEDGTELYKYNVPYGMMPLYTGDIPTKEADKKYTYTFAGWTPSLAAVTWDATYTVKFNSKKKWGKRSGGWKWGNSDPEPTHGSADDERPQDYPDTPADTPVDEPKWEIFDVHKWAYENWLTKFGDINDARMNDPITRSEMAKISSIFDTNFLGKTPDESKESECSSYPDIQNMGGDLYYFVVQSCELKNMWYHYDNENHIENFMPYNPLNVAQASVILSRMAWWKKYIIGPEKWYQWHMYAVYEHVLIDNTSDPWRHITRREAFTAFYRLDKLLKEKK